ncbi:hypothetical protein FSP39_006525 [Pinctada imbricata]|uniref:Novel STAND NTPase 3 domain-containing protein n=1 Tax=Pinctada imbricata TaxID=66713 RepID=A0AA88YGT6_PINIB|nr:hypothetical protein FSP39_006525 [Pinctada imbricata]
MTLLEIQEHKKSLYVRRERIEDAMLRMLSRTNTRICIVSGKPGFGKTSLCFEILSHFTFESNSNIKSYILKEPAEWRKIIASEDEKLVLIDDFLGKTNLDENLLQGWERHFTSMEAILKKSNYAIVFSVRDELLQLANETLKKYGIFKSDNVICISSKEFLMTGKEKKRMLNAYSIRFEHEIYRWMEDRAGMVTHDDSFLLSHKDIDDISHTDPLDGFPQACYLFFTNVNFYTKKLHFFTNATDSVCESISMLYSPDDRSLYVQYLLLVVLMLKNGEHPLSEMTVDDMKSLCDDLEVRYPNSLLVENALRRLEKSYIKKLTSEVKTFSFTHESVLEAVLLSFGKHFPASLLRHADQKVLFNFVRSSQYKRKGREICIVLPEVWNVGLAERVSLAKDLNVANHPSRTDPAFVKAVLDYLEKAHSEMKIDDFKAVMEDLLTALCRNKGHIFLEALVNRILDITLYPSPSTSILQKCLFESVSSSDLFSGKEILKILDISSLDKEGLTQVLKEAVNRHSNNVDIIKYLLQTTEDRRIQLDLAIYALNLSKWKIVRWMSLKSIACDPLQSIFSFILLNSINYSKHDITEKLLTLSDISQDVFDNALELASTLPDPVTIISLTKLKRFSEIPTKTLLNLIWRTCVNKKEEVLYTILEKSDMSKVRLDQIVEIIHKAKISCYLSEENSSKLLKRLCETAFIPGSKAPEKENILLNALSERKNVQAPSDESVMILSNIFELSAAEIKDAVHLRDQDMIKNSLQIFKQHPVPLVFDNVRENLSKSLMLAFQYGMTELCPAYDNAFKVKPILSDHVDAIVMVCVHDDLEKEIMDLLEQSHTKTLRESTAEVLYLHGLCTKNETLMTKLKEQFNFKEDVLQTGSLLTACNQTDIDIYPSEILEKALHFTVLFKPKHLQDDLLEKLQMTKLSNEFLVDLLPHAVLRSTSKLIVSLLQVIFSSVSAYEKIEEAICLAVKFREADIVERFISIVGKDHFSQKTICCCIDESLELYSEEMSTLLVQKFGDALLTSKNVTQTIRYGSSKFLEVVLQNSKISKSDLFDGIFVAVCCEEIDTIQTLVNATDVDLERKRKVREDLFKVEKTDALGIFQSLEAQLGQLFPSLQVKEEQFLQAIKHEKTNVVQAILSSFPEPPIPPEAMEIGFKDALRNRDEVSIALIMCTCNVMDNPIVAKFAVNYAMFNHYKDILPVLLDERCFPYSVLQEAIMNAILINGGQQFEILVDHLNKDSLTPEQVASIFQYIFMSYREGIAEMFRTKFDTTALQHQTARNVVKATISQQSNKMSTRTIMRLKNMHVPRDIINETLLELIMMALLGRNVVHVKNYISHLDTEVTPDDTMLSILFITVQNRMFELSEYVINLWNFKEYNNRQKIVKIILMFNAYPLLDTAFNKISEVDDQLFIHVVSETFQRKQPCIVRSLLSKAKIKYETVLSLYFLCLSLKADDMSLVIAEMYESAKCDIALRHKENTLMLSVAMNNLTMVSTVLENLKCEIPNFDPEFFRSFFHTLQEKFKVEEVTAVVNSLNPASVPSSIALEILNWSLREADIPTIQSLFSMYKLPNEDCLLLKENAIKRFGPLEESDTLYSRSGDTTHWPRWLLDKYLGTTSQEASDTASDENVTHDDSGVIQQDCDEPFDKIP